MNKPLIYLASPYSSDNGTTINRRVTATQQATAKLIEQGNLIFSPIVHSHPIADLVSFSPINTAKAMSGWTAYDEAIIDKCDEVWVLMLDGWDKSRGVSHEIAYAFANKKPMRSVSFPELVVSEDTLTSFTHPSLPSENVYDQADGFREDLSSAIDEAPRLSKEAADRILTRIFGEDEARPVFDKTYFDKKYYSVVDEAAPFTTAMLADLKSRLDRTYESTFYGATPMYSPSSSGLPPLPPRDVFCFCGNPACPGVEPSILSVSEWAEKYQIATLKAEPLKTFANTVLGEPERSVSLPDDAGERNSYPMADGLLHYFPNALAEVSRVSQIGAEQHLPGQPMHWARGLSTDHANKIVRHLIDAGKKDANGTRHSAFVAWRALALLQEELETDLNLPLPKNARPATVQDEN